MPALEKNGYSYKITITGEEKMSNSVIAGGSRLTKGALNPPKLSNTNAYSAQLGRVNKYNHWAFRKIVEPRYDKIGLITGIPENYPDLVQEHHIISVMRSIEPLLHNTPQALLQVWTTSVSVKQDKK